MTQVQVFSAVDAFLVPRPRRNPWDLATSLSNTVRFLVEEWEQPELTADQKKELVGKFAKQMTDVQLGIARGEVNDRVATLTGTRDAPTTQANERAVFQGYIDQYTQFIAEIDAAIEDKEKVTLVHKAFARKTGQSLPEALELTKQYSGLGARRRRTRRVHRRRRVTRRLRRV